MNTQEFFVLLFFLIVGIVPIIYFYSQSGVITEKDKNINDKDLTNNHLNDKNIKESLLMKYEDAKKNSSLMLVFTVVTLFIGSIAFYNASAIASYDKGNGIKSQNMKEGINNKYLNIYANHDLRINLDSLINQRSSFNEETRNKTESYYEKIKRESRLKYFKEIHLEIDQLLKSDTISEQESSRIFWSNFFTTFSIRIMISLFTIYMSQIFLKLYRYNLNISDFYINRYDAMLASSNKELNLNFKQACSIFQHNIDFGETPKSPIETSIEILKVLKDFK